MKISRIAVVSLILICMAFLSSCEIHKESKKTDSIAGIKIDPLVRISFAFINAMGFGLEKTEDSIIVSKLARFGVARLSGMDNGMIVESIAGINLSTLDSDGAQKIVDSLMSGKVSVLTISEDNSRKEFNLEFTSSNCPQRRYSDFLYVSKPNGLNPPNIIMVQLVKEINQMNFTRGKLTGIHYFTPKSGDWFTDERPQTTFSTDVQIENFSGTTIPELTIDPDSDELFETGSDGSINYTTKDISFGSAFQILKNYPINGNIYLCSALFTGMSPKSESVTDQGFMFIRHENEFHSKPFYKESNRVEYLPLSESSPHVTESVYDWMILFDGNGGMLDLAINGVKKNWNGIFLESASENKAGTGLKEFFSADEFPFLLKSHEMIWFDGTIPGKENVPYPQDISLEFPSIADGRIFVRSFSPCYTDKNDRIMMSVAGQIEIPGKDPIPVSGFLLRYIY
jgi:hypothetical protein